MLTHNHNKRISFKEMKQYFHSIEAGLKASLISKYGEEAPGLEAFQNELRLTKSICPYQSNAKGGNSLADMAQRLK